MPSLVNQTPLVIISVLIGNFPARLNTAGEAGLVRMKQRWCRRGRRSGLEQGQEAQGTPELSGQRIPLNQWPPHYLLICQMRKLRRNEGK